MPEKVVVAEKEVTVHKVDPEGGFTESVTLLPGQEFPFANLAVYQQEAVTAGKAFGLSIKSSKAAKEVAKEEATVETEDN